MKGGSSLAIAPNDAGEWLEVSTQFELEAACMKENESKFRQANNTPFMVSPLLDDFGYLPVGPNADRVLRGEYQPPPDANPYATRLLQHLQVPPKVAEAAPVLNVITTEQYIARRVEEIKRTDILWFYYLKFFSLQSRHSSTEDS